MQEDWVLCRVFHKSKAEENNNNQCQHMHDHFTASTSSPPTCYTCQQTNNSFSSNNPTLSQEPIISHINPNLNNVLSNNNYSPTSLNPNTNLLHLLKEGNSSYSWSDLVSASVKNDDDYGFLWDITMEDQTISKLGEGSLHVPPNCLPQLEFDQDDCGTVFF